MEDLRHTGQDLAMLMSMLGYPGIFITMLIEGSGVPLPFPGALFLALIGYTVWQGYLDIGAAALAGAAGFSIGAWLLYRISRYAGPRVAAAYTRRFGIPSHKLGASQRWFVAHAAAAVVVGRLTPGVRIYVSIVAGMARMRQTRFLICTFVGSYIYVAAVLVLSRSLGENWTQVSGSLDLGQSSLLLLLALLLVAVVARRQVDSAG